MQILDANQIRGWDEYTIKHEPISSLDLMERAALRCFEWIISIYHHQRNFSVFCGNGNNGGDGLVIARMLALDGRQVTVNIVDSSVNRTQNFLANLAMLPALNINLRLISTADTILPVPETDIIIDALFGSGLNRPADGVMSKIIEHINSSGKAVLAIDIPSGLFVDRSSKGNIAVQATHTLSFQCFKPAFVVAENDSFIGQVHILDIGLHPGYIEIVKPTYKLSDISIVKPIFRRRKKFSHKGNFGHALLIAGSYGKMGAAVLAARACVKGGVGLLTIHSAGCGYEILQLAVPEGMVSSDKNEKIISHLPEDMLVFSAVGVGPGIGTGDETAKMISSLFADLKVPVVLDADALNIIARNPTLKECLPSHSIITPHPKEFEHLFGSVSNDFQRIELAKEKSAAHNIIIILKGRYTLIATPGTLYFNTTGNPGMATGGSGDVLTGLITALIAQHYPAEEAAIIGTYIHGFAGDLASSAFSEESMSAPDIIDFFGPSFRMLY